MSTQSNNSLVTYGDVKSMITNSFQFNETTESIKLTIYEDGQVTSGLITINTNIDINDFSMMFFSEIIEVIEDQATTYFPDMTLYTQTHVIAPIILSINTTSFTFTEIVGPYKYTDGTSIVRTDSFILNTEVSIKNNKYTTGEIGYTLRFKYSVSKETGFTEGTYIMIYPRIQFFNNPS